MAKSCPEIKCTVLVSQLCLLSCILLSEVLCILFIAKEKRRGYNQRGW